MTCRISLVAVCCSSASASSIRSRCDCAEPAVRLLLARSSSATRFRSCAFSVMSSAFVMDMLHSQGARVRFTPVPSTPPPPAPGRTAWLGPPIGQAQARNDAHSRQNFAWGGFSVWHRGHRMADPPREPGRGRSDRWHEGSLPSGRGQGPRARTNGRGHAVMASGATCAAQGGGSLSPTRLVAWNRRPTRAWGLPRPSRVRPARPGPEARRMRSAGCGAGGQTAGSTPRSLRRAR